MSKCVESGSLRGRPFGGVMSYRQRVCYFLLVINSNLGLKVEIASSYPPQFHKSPSIGVTHFEFRDAPDI